MEAKHMGEAGGIQKVKTTDVSKDILNKFWILSEGKEEKRLHETKNLLSVLKIRQLDHSKLSNKTSPLCGELQYSLRRLVKGLSSSKKWARVGFATALTQILAVFPEIQIKDVVTLIEETLTFTQHESKGEQGNILFGKVTALITVIRSHRLDEGCEEEVQRVVSSLISLQGKRSYLQKPCVSGLQSLINSVNKEMFKEHILPQLREELSEGWEGCTPQRLQLVLTASRKGFLDKKHLKSSWNARSVMDKQNWGKVQEVLINSATNPPIIHPVNDLIVEQLSTDQSLLEFWSQISAKLFQPGKKKLIHLGLFYLKSVIRKITTTTQFLEVFSPAVCQSILRNLSCKEVSKSVEDIVVTLATESQDGHLQSVIVRHLLCESIRFAQVPFLRTVIRNLNPEGTTMFSCDLMKLLIGEKLREDVSFTQDSIRKWAALQLKFLVSHPAMVDNTDQLLIILQFLCLHSFFVVNSAADEFKHVTGPVPKPLPDHVRTCVQDCFFGAVNSLNIPDKRQRRDLNSSLQLLYRLTRYALSLLATDAVSAVKTLPEQVVEELEKTLDTVQKVQSKKTSNTPDSHAFQILYLHLGLQLLAEPKEAMDILKDLHICFEKSHKKSRKSSKNKEEEEPAWIEVLTELLISMMSQQSRLTRTVSRTVFHLLSQHVTRNALDLIINVLHLGDDQGEEGAIIFEEEDADSDEEEDENDEKRNDSPVNGNHDNKNGSHDKHDDDDNVSRDDEEDSGNDTDEDAEVDDQLRQTVKAALGPAAAESDKDEESDEDDDMGDEEMFRLDDALSEAFCCVKRGKSKERKKRKQQLLKFKLRTLDLVETFVKTQPSAGLLVHLVGPALDLMESGYRHKEESQLGKRAARILHLILKSQKRDTDPDVDQEETLDKMKGLMQYSTKVFSLHMVKEVSWAFNFMMRVILNCEPETDEHVSPVKTRSRAMAKETPEQKTVQKPDIYVERVLDMIKSALSDYLNKKDARLHYIFFHNILERYWSVMWPLSDMLLNCVTDESVRVFLRTQACSMLSVLLKPDMQVHVGEDVWMKFAKKFTASLSQILLSLKKENFKPKHTHEILVLVFRFLMADKTQGKKLVENAKDNLESLRSAMNSDTKKVWKKLVSQVSRGCTNVKSAKTKKERSREKKRTDRQEATEEMECSSPAKTQKLSPEKITEQTLSPRKQKGGANPAGNSDENEDLLSDSTVTSSLSEASGETTPNKKSKLMSGNEVTSLSEDSVSSSSSRKRKVRTPRKSAVS